MPDPHLPLLLNNKITLHEDRMFQCCFHELQHAKISVFVIINIFSILVDLIYRVHKRYMKKIMILVVAQNYIIDRTNNSVTDNWLLMNK